MTAYVPFLFVLLWSTGFIGAKYGLQYAEPFTLLSWRMVFVVPMFATLVFILQRPRAGLYDASIQGLVGLLIHGAYLGGTFAAIYSGIPAGLAALIVSLNPLLIAAFSIVILGIKISIRQWIALLLGLSGVTIVLLGASTWQGVISASGLGWLLFALLGICAGTLIQKRYAASVDIVTGSVYQYSAALLFFTACSFLFETREVSWTVPLILTLTWLVVVLSLFAVLLLLYMIRQGEATRVASYFYLVPPLTALEGWVLFNEPWNWSTAGGAALIISALALYARGRD